MRRFFYLQEDDAYCFTIFCLRSALFSSFADKKINFPA